MINILKELEEIMSKLVKWWKILEELYNCKEEINGKCKVEKK